MSRGPIGILGGGAWGTALAAHAARLGFEVSLWVRESEAVRSIRDRRENTLYLPGVRLPRGVRAVGTPAEAVGRAAWVLAVVPAQFARRVYAEVAAVAPPDVPLVVATKGIEAETLALPLDVLREALAPRGPIAVLSGPSFAREVAEGLPTAMVVASSDAAHAKRIQLELSSETLRLYTNPDPVGVQVAGALKNVIAIAAGVADGLEMGSNTRAALITRGLAELSRLGRRLGGRSETFSGLAGLGDLVLTCTGDLSRNRQVGRRLGRGDKLGDILADSRSVAEGVVTTRSARALAQREKIQMPIVEEVHRILWEDGSPREALSRLMRRALVAEEGSGGEGGA